MAKHIGSQPNQQVVQGKVRQVAPASDGPAAGRVDAYTPVLSDSDDLRQTKPISASPSEPDRGKTSMPTHTNDAKQTQFDCAGIGNRRDSRESHRPTDGAAWPTLTSQRGKKRQTGLTK